MGRRLERVQIPACDLGASSPKRASARAGAATMFVKTFKIRLRKSCEKPDLRKSPRRQRVTCSFSVYFHYFDLYVVWMMAFGVCCFEVGMGF